MSSQGILGLPTLAFDMIYQHFTYRELIALSGCSKRMRDVIRGTERCLKKHTDIDLIVRKHERIICVGDEDGPRKPTQVGSVDWKLEKPPKPEDIERYKYETVNWEFDGVMWEMRVNGFGWAYDKTNEDAACLQWLAYLMNLFHGHFRILYMELCPQVNFRKLLVDSEQLRSAEAIRITSKHVTSFQMTFMLNNLTADFIRLNVDLPPSYHYHGLLGRALYHEIQDGEWMRMRSVWRMAQNIRQLVILRGKCSSGELNKFLKKWLKSDNRTMEYVQIHDPNPSRELDPDVVFKGIPTTPGTHECYTKLPELLSRPRVYLNDGETIRREDGLRATISLQKTYYNRYTIFTVWHDDESVAAASS